MRIALWVGAMGVVACTSGAAGQAAAPLQGTASYRIKPRTENCAFGYQTASVRYTVVGTGAVPGAQPPHLVLEERVTMDRCESHEGGHGQVTVVARPAERPAARPAWTIRQAGDEGGPWYGEELGGEEMYRVLRYGCCGAENLSTYYSLRTGHRLFSADKPLLYIEVRGIASGYAALHGANAADGGPGGGTDRTQVAIVSFGGPGRVLQHLLIRGPSNEFAASRFELVARGPAGQVKRGRRLDINDELGAGWSVTVALELQAMSGSGPAREILIPLENGRLAVEKARVPAPFRIGVAPAAAR
ncbi:MAG TPA: hypothetical protein VEX86_10785 [Longimicrobium sp.]|nr:hypothetical protein [Longimicrobium sp.]